MNQFWIEHLNRLRDSLLAQTERIRAGSGHSTIKGSSIEAVVRRTLREYLPTQFHIGTGQVANNQQEISPQIDALVYDRSTFSHLAVNEDSSVVICCEPLLAAVECKSRWDGNDVVNHYSGFAKVESKRYEHFAERGMAAGYFVLIIDNMSSPNLASLQDMDRFVGVYSLASGISWSSSFDKSDFSEQTGNALEMFLQHVML